MPDVISSALIDDCCSYDDQLYDEDDYDGYYDSLYDLDESFYDDFIDDKRTLNDSLRDYGVKVKQSARKRRRPKRQTRDLDFGEELKCEDNSDCQSWIDNKHFCIRDRCIQKFCNEDDDCPHDSFCFDKFCITGVSCSKNSDCPPGLVCNYGVCDIEIQEPECRRDHDCPQVPLVF